MWKKITSKVLITHPRLTVIEDQVELPDGSQVPYLKFDHKNDSVTVLCFNADDELLMQQEYSYPPDTMLYQFPGGKIEAGESPLEAARRELREESGLEGKVFTSIGWYYAHNRRSADKAHVFVVKNATKTKQFGGDPEESITSEWITVKKFTELISDGQIQNASALAAWSLYVHAAK